MKLKIKVEDFLPALEYISPAIQDKNVIPETRFMKIAHNYVVGTDTKIELTAKINPTEVSDEGVFLVDFQKLFNLTRAYEQDAFLTLSITESSATVTCKKSKAKLNVLNASAFPSMVIGDEVKSFSTNGAILSETMSSVGMAMPPVTAKKADARPALNGLFVESSSEGVNIVASDGLRLNKSSVSATKAEDFSIIIPSLSVGLVAKTLAQIDDTVTIQTDEQVLVIKTNERVIKTTLVQYTYPDYKRIIPNNVAATIKFKSSQFKDAVKRITAVTNKDKYSHGVIDVSPQDTEGTIRGKSVDRSESADVIPMSCESEAPVEIGFNTSYLLAAISIFDDEMVELTIHNPTNVMKIEKDDTIAVCAPVRI